MPKATKVIQSPNLAEFVKLVVEASRDGWEIDDMNPPSLYGYFYETVLLKDENDVEPPKPTRAEILAKARASKAQKAAESDVEQKPEGEATE